MKRFILFILIISILITSCTWSEDSRFLSKVEKNYEKYNGYKCKANIKMVTGDKESVYVIEETFKKPSKYKLEILQPKESKGIIILNTDDKVTVKHPSINQFISVVTIKSLNSQLLIGDFFENISKVKALELEEIDGEEYLRFEISLQEKSKYRDTAKIWLKNKTYIPHKLNIFDEGGNIQVEITYEEFKFIKN